MKKTLLIALAAATGMFSYLLIRNNFLNAKKHTQANGNAHPKKHHLTQAFANAKKYAMNEY